MKLGLPGLLTALFFASLSAGTGAIAQSNGVTESRSSSRFLFDNVDLYSNQPYQQAQGKIQRLRRANDLNGLVRLADDVQQTWGLQTDQSGYYALMDTLTSAFVSNDFGFVNVQKQDELARKYVLITLAHGNVPLDMEARLLPCLIPEEKILRTRRPFAEARWAQMRRERVPQWLQTWQGIENAIIPNYDLTSRLVINNVIDLDELKDPKRVAKRQQETQEMNRKIQGREDQLLLRSIAKSFSPLAEDEVVSLYSSPPYDLQELKRFLETYVKNAAVRQRILDRVAQSFHAEPNTLNTRIDSMQDAGPVTEGLQMSAHLEKSEVQAGNPVWLTVILKNTTSQNIYLGVSGSEQDLFQITVKDTKGKDIAPTHWGLSHVNVGGQVASDPTTVFSRIIEPGKAIQYQFLINRMFDLSDSISYQVTVIRRGIPKLDGKGMTNLASNVAQVTIVEPSPELGNSQSFFHR